MLAALVVVAGCYDWAPVRPTELPKLSAGARELERADGGRFEVRHVVTAKVDTPYGAVKFKQPLAVVEDGTLAIADATGAEARIPLEQIKGVQVGQINVGDTVFAIVGAGAVVVGTVVLLLLMRSGPGSGRGIE